MRRAGRRAAAPVLALALGLVGAGTAPLFAQTGTAPARPPERIVSINLCTDQILLDLVPRERIRAISHLASDRSVSALYDRVAGIAATRGEAEAVLALDPDLVLAGAYSTPATGAVLERLGRRVEKVPAAQDIEGIKAVVRRVAEAEGERERGEAVVGAFERWLAEAVGDTGRSEAGKRPSALVYQVNNIASGSGNLADNVLAAAGFTNHAVHLGLGAGGKLALESLIASPPDLLVLTGPVDEYRTVTADNLRHPALARLRAERATVTVPWRYWLCGTPYVAEAVRRLVEARKALIERRAAR